MIMRHAAQIDAPQTSLCRMRARSGYLPWWKARCILSSMETSANRPTPDEAAAALLDAGSGRDQLSQQLTLPSWFHASIGLAIVVQIATLAVGVADQSLAGIGLAVAGLVPFVLVAVVQL